MATIGFVDVSSANILQAWSHSRQQEIGGAREGCHSSSYMQVESQINLEILNRYHMSRDKKYLLKHFFKLIQNKMSIVGATK